MTIEEQTITLNVAVCADSPDDQTMLKAYVRARGWKHSGHVYRFDNWQNLVADAKDGKFNTVCATHEGLRWLVQIAPETDFPRAQRGKSVSGALRTSHRRPSWVAQMVLNLPSFASATKSCQLSNR